MAYRHAAQKELVTDRAQAVFLHGHVSIEAAIRKAVGLARRKRPQSSKGDHAQHRVGRPEDIASLVRFLLSGESGFITGSHVLADGGMTRKMIHTD